MHVLRWPGRQGANRLHGASNNRHREGSMNDFVQLMNEFSAEIDKTVAGRNAARARLTQLEAENARLRDALEECREYFDDRADASIEPGDSYFHGNAEMTLLVTIDAALGREG
jgi:hypothetical protein